ncbi:MAG: hypothetical protein JWO98_5304 [Frankiales bacterium]|nr:hypothetical protein [Frankiales bacterium]
MSTWADVGKGDHITVRGNDFVVVKVKRDGKKIDVKVTSAAGTFASTVKAKDAVEIVKAPKKRKEPLYREVANSGRLGEQQTRWATKREQEAADEPVRASLPVGDPEVTKRPHKASGGPWESPRGKAERAVADILGAVLVGEAEDEDAGFYVPPIDLSTVAAHLLLFHGVGGDQYAATTDALTLHANMHADAATGAAMTVNHWHTKERP